MVNKPAEEILSTFTSQHLMNTNEINCQDDTNITTTATTAAALQTQHRRRWVCFSDSDIKLVTEAEVLSSQAYLLFYEKLQCK